MENNKDEKIVNFNENGKEMNSSSSLNLNRKRNVAKISILVFVVLLIIPIITNDSGLGLILMPLYFVAYVWFPIYFIILSLKYLKEKDKLDSYEKIAFFVLLLGLIVWAGSVFLFQ